MSQFLQHQEEAQFHNLLMPKNNNNNDHLQPRASSLETYYIGQEQMCLCPN